MKITFVRPNMFDQRSSDAMEPLCFAILKSLTPTDVETVFYDERLEAIPYDESTDLVAMTVETYTARRSYQIAAEYRRRGVKVVMGGYHPSFLPDEALQFADAVVVGDAEGIWPEVVDDAQHHQLREIYRQEQFPSLRNSQPDRSIFRGKRYAPITLLQYARGCKYNCDFCSIRAFYGTNLRQRPVDEVVAEINQGVRKHIFIVDDNVFVDIRKAKELFEALIPLKIRWSCQVSIDIAKDPELVELMRRSGCTTAVVGFESLNKNNLAQMNKAWNLRYGDYDTSIKILQDAGIMIYGTFVFGYDADTVDSFDEAVDFAIQNKFYLANFNPLTPTPRAPLLDRLRDEGRLIYDKWWLEPNYRYGAATFHPRNDCRRTDSWLLPRPKQIQPLRFDCETNLRSTNESPQPVPFRSVFDFESDFAARDPFKTAVETGRRSSSGTKTERCDARIGGERVAMKITFIKPNIGRMEHSLYVDEGRMEPLQLGVLAGLTPADVECVLYDDRIEEIPYDERTDLAAITVEIYTARRAYEIAAEFRARGVPVIMGGFHPTLVPDECLQHADSIYIGDAEFRWHEVVEDARRGNLQEVYEATAGIPQSNGSQPRRGLFDGKGYLPITLMQFSRGCRFACDFCAISVFFDRTQYVRPTRDVLAEIENQNRKLIFFVDDSFLSNHDAAKSFLRELIPLRIKWVSQATLDMTHDPELMELLAESGCIGNVIGFESLNPENLKAMKKAPNLMRKGHRTFAGQGWDRYQSQCEVLRDHHLQTWAAFTLGHDGDTLESIQETFDFAMHNKFCFAAYNILMPYPKTPLYDRLRQEDRLLWGGKWWLHPEYRFNHAAFVPKNMSPEELTEACWQCRYQWNTKRSIFKRAWDFKTHMSSLTRFMVYLQYNPIYAKEAYKKQGMLFGLFRKSETGRQRAQFDIELPDADTNGGTNTGEIAISDQFLSVPSAERTS